MSSFYKHTLLEDFELTNIKNGFNPKMCFLVTKKYEI